MLGVMSLVRLRIEMKKEPMNIDVTEEFNKNRPDGHLGREHKESEHQVFRLHAFFLENLTIMCWTGTSPHQSNIGFGFYCCQGDEGKPPNARRLYSTSNFSISGKHCYPSACRLHHRGGKSNLSRCDLVPTRCTIKRNISKSQWPIHPFHRICQSKALLCSISLGTTSLNQSFSSIQSYCKLLYVRLSNEIQITQVSPLKINETPQSIHAPAISHRRHRHHRHDQSSFIHIPNTYRPSSPT